MVGQAVDPKLNFLGSSDDLPYEPYTHTQRDRTVARVIGADVDSEFGT